MQAITQPTGFRRPFRDPSHRLIATALTVTASAAAPAWGLVIDNGTTNVIDTTINDFIDVFDSDAGDPTTVTFNTGANITGFDAFDNSVYVDDSSIVVINDGTFAQDITGFTDASITINGGDLRDDVFAGDDVTLSITGGTIADNVEVVDRANATIIGGTIDDNLTAEDFGTIVVLGGDIGNDVESVGFGTLITLRGGTFGSDIEAADGGQIDIFGGEIGLTGSFDNGIGASSFSTIRVHGQDFTVNGVPVGFGPLSGTGGTLAGTLSDGSTFEMPYDRARRNRFSPRGNIILVDLPVPEPGSLALLAVGAVVVLRRAARRDR